MSSVMNANPAASATAPRERMELILDQLDKLPTLPAVAARLMETTSSQRSSAREVSQIIESDAAMTALILRLARRADRGIESRGLTTARAVIALGFRAVRDAIFAIQIYGAVAPAEGNEKAAKFGKELWKHSLAAACTARMIAEQARTAASREDAFLCGLLHDIGKLALLTALPKGYLRAVDLAERKRMCICDAEREVLGLDHTTAGRRLASRWRLPDGVVESVWLHHQDPEHLPSSVHHPDLVRIIHLADNLVRRQRIGFSGYGHIADIKEAAAALELEEAWTESAMERLPDEMAPYCDLVGLDEGAARALYAKSLAKINQELAEVNARLTDQNGRLEMRSACFAAIGYFNEMLSGQDRVSDVCIAAASSVRRLVGANAAACVVGASGRLMHVGWADASGNTTSSILDGTDWPPSGKIGPLTTGLIPAPPELEGVWRPFRSSSSSSPLWMWPLACGNETFGAVLFPADGDTVAGFGAAAEECAAVSTVIGLAILSADARNESERTHEELLDLNRRMAAAQRALVRGRSLSMIAEMAAGAAHELNNPLAVISGRAQMQLAHSSDEELRRCLETIVDQSHRASRIVLDLMDFAKPATPQPVVQRLAPLLESLCQRWRLGGGLDNDQPTLCVGPEAAVFADPAQLEEILGAVVANSLEACRSRTPRLHINSPTLGSDDKVRIIIEDNGVGMTREVLEHAVDPFFSSRPAGRGRGLGLSRAVRLAEINGGSLRLESVPDTGTSVTIELPARRPAP